MNRIKNRKKEVGKKRLPLFGFWLHQRRKMVISGKK